jgi:anaerobic selenocysteine-containing dehydrogenase
MLMKRGYKVVQDTLQNALTGSADVLLPSAFWAEKDGCWENFQGILQAFTAAVPPAEGARREGDVYQSLLERPGLYNAAQVRQEMGETFAAVQLPTEDAEAPAFAFSEL